MKHPTREQLVAFLYEDCDRADKSEIAQHLDTCAECRNQIQTWRATATTLNKYEMAPAVSAWTPVRSWLPISAAAAVFLVAGAMFGATWQTRADSGKSQLIAELRDRVEKSESENAQTKKLLADLTESIAENRAKDHEAFVAVAQELQSTRKDVETMAVLTEAGLKSTQNQLVRLANYAPDSK
jgi:anti-sigma factor ChrR (cupin superfamily)